MNQLWMGDNNKDYESNWVFQGRIFLFPNLQILYIYAETHVHIHCSFPSSTRSGSSLKFTFQLLVLFFQKEFLLAPKVRTTQK